MKQVQMKEIPITYNDVWEIVDIPTKSEEWYPPYLKYMLEYLEIPLTPKLRIKFLDKSIVFEDFLKEAQNK